ncbi:MAG: hypothetical protein OEZ22_08105 [Spirochaetia bacterium]|nr:hypothetical protein [Spirochaetia bacterium]
MDTAFFIPALIWLIFLIILMARGDLKPVILVLALFIFAAHFFFWYEGNKSVIMGVISGESVFNLKLLYNTFHMAFIALPWIWATAGFILTKIPQSDEIRRIIIVLSIFSLIVWICYSLLSFANIAS